MNEERLKSIIREFHTRPRPLYVPRSVHIPLHTEKIISLIGPRRSGKTSQCFNLINQLLKQGVRIETILYINFEDERLALATDELNLILSAYQTLYPDLQWQHCYFFFDEIQNIEHWDKFIRRIYDTYSKNIFITGSNAKLLSKEIATSLRGRALSYEILPFSFKEVCQFQKINVDLYDPQQLANIKRQLGLYLQYGGFPEILHQDDLIKVKILQEYFNVMMYQDLVERYQIKNVGLLKFFLKRLYASATKSFSIHKIYNELHSAGYKFSKDILYDFLEMAENIYLVKTLRKYTSKLIQSEIGEKKLYVIDNGLLNAMSFKFSDDMGKCMEQVVMQELLRREQEIYFYKKTYEADFLIKKDTKIVEAIQVCYDLTDHETYQREIRGLISACKAHKLKQATLISYNEKSIVTESDIQINIIPLYEFLLQ